MVITPKTNKKGANRRVTETKTPNQVLKIENSHFPMQYQAGMHIRQRIRYVAGTGGIYTITRANLLSTLIVCTANSTASAFYRIAEGVKVNRIEAFSPPTTATSFVRVFVEWLSNLGPSTMYSSLGDTSQPAKIITSPPRNSLAGFWSITGANESESLFSLGCPGNTIIDVFYDIILQNAEASTQVTCSTTGSIGQLYATALNGPSGASPCYAADLNSIN
jgi:hypothetical protein